ncbi:hypothetical protein [Armatimonas sp.]|uniref:hypothetical protein n=1 Tax=Armatimonas sp. TaxID=1872638 RepID=UPI00286C3337|nr:hypothetical protein [Armatimonas sp.]
MTDDVFLATFEDTSLPRYEWTHFAHVRMAFLYLSYLSYDEAEAAIVTGIQRYNAAKSNGVGYHQTITIAFARLIASRLTENLTWPAFVAANPDLLSFACIQKHYSPELLKSQQARTEFVEPDLGALPSLG